MKKSDLTKNQLAILFDIFKNPTIKRYNLGFYLHFRNKLDLNLFKKALNIIYSKENALNISIIKENNNYFQKIEEDISPKLDIVDCSNQKIKEEIKKVVERMYNIFSDRLIRNYLFKINEEEYYFLIAAHHIIFDTYSAKNYFENFSDIYLKLIQEKNYNLEDNCKPSESIDNRNLDSNYSNAINFWKNKCRGLSKLNLLGFDSKSENEISNKTKISEDISKKIRIYCEENKIKIVNFFKIVYALLIKKYYQPDSDFYIMDTFHGRAKNKKKELGFFVDLFPIVFNTIELEEESINSISSKLEESIREILSTEKVDLMSIKKILNNEGLEFHFNYRPKSLVYLSFLNNQIILQEMNSYATPNLIELIISEKKDLFDIEIYYLSNETNFLIENFINKFELLAKQIVEGIELTNNLNFLEKTEEEQLLTKFNDTKIDYPKDKQVNELFEKIVQKYPENIALTFNNKNMSYKELNFKSNQLAKLLREKGVGPDECIGLLVSRGFNMIIAIIAILKAGSAYVPIDSEYPKERVKYVLKDCEAKILLTEKSQKDNFEFDKEVIYFDEFNLEKYDDSNLSIISKPNNLVYLIYTSGSTGLPKGVMIENKNVVNFIIAMQEKLRLVEGRSFLNITTISFDIFVLETIVALCSGMNIIIASENERVDMKELSKLIKFNNPDFIQMTPSHMQLLLNYSLGSSCLKNAKNILLGGEQVSQYLVDRLKEITSARIYDVYGPTETTVWST